MTKRLLLSALVLLTASSAFAGAPPAKLAEAQLKQEDLALLEQSRPQVKRYNVQSEGWMLKVEDAKKDAKAL